VWLNIFSLLLSLSAVLFSVYIYLESSKKLSRGDLRSEVENACEEITKTSSRQIKEIEAEWDNMYQKFTSLAGRMDRKKALTPAAPEPAEPVVRTRSELLKRRRENV
jgi:small-conductance mechanosensitive channel